MMIDNEGRWSERRALVDALWAVADRCTDRWQDDRYVTLLSDITELAGPTYSAGLRILDEQLRPRHPSPAERSALRPLIRGPIVEPELRLARWRRTSERLSQADEIPIHMLDVEDVRALMEQNSLRLSDAIAHPHFDQLRSWWLGSGWHLERDALCLRRMSPDQVQALLADAPDRLTEATRRLALPAPMLKAAHGLETLRRRIVMWVGQSAASFNEAVRPRSRGSVALPLDVLAEQPKLTDIAFKVLDARGLPSHIPRTLAAALVHHRPTVAAEWGLSALARADRWAVLADVLSWLVIQGARAEAFYREASQCPVDRIALLGRLGLTSQNLETPPPTDGCLGAHAVWHGQQHAAGRAASTQWLLEQFWSEDPAGAAIAIRAYGTRNDVDLEPVVARLRDRHGSLGTYIKVTPTANACFDVLRHVDIAAAELTLRNICVQTHDPGHRPRGLTHMLSVILAQREDYALDDQVRLQKSIEHARCFVDLDVWPSLYLATLRAFGPAEQVRAACR